MDAPPLAWTRTAMDALVRPAAICIVGASGTRVTRGNIAIRSMQKWRFPGRIVPIHAQAESIEGLPTVRSIEDLPPGIDAAFIAVPAASVRDVILRLDRAGVRAAVVIAAGFSPAEEAALRETMAGASILVHGPNCMGLLNLSDSLPFYSAEISPKVVRGSIALLAQSGSAAIAMMNTLDAGVSKVATVGSEFRVTAADYLDWLADDPETSVIGVILEAIQSPTAFAAAVRRVQAMGKSVVVLKVGRSAAGVLAAQAHTGALITPADAYACFFRDLGVPMVADYEQLAASLKVMAATRRPAPGTGVALVGISGGETALACDLAADLGLRLADFSAATSAKVREVLPGVSGRNPLDVGASVGHEQTGGDLAALTAIAADPDVGMVLALQDLQGTLPGQLVQKYRHAVGVIAALCQRTEKPVIIVSPTPDAVNPDLVAPLVESGVPVLRGLPAALAALRSLSVAAAEAGPAEAGPEPLVSASVLAALRAAIGAYEGALPAELCQRILAAYGIPFIRSVLIGPESELPADAAISFPVVAKIASSGISHRSDIGGVRLGIADRAALGAAIAGIRDAVTAARPDAVIEGFEIEEEMTGCIEALAGFPPCRPSMLHRRRHRRDAGRDRGRSCGRGLGALTDTRAAAMITGTRLGKRLDGYRNRVPKTPLDALAGLVSRLSRLGADLADVIAACDLNPGADPTPGRARSGWSMC